MSLSTARHSPLAKSRTLMTEQNGPKKLKRWVNKDNAFEPCSFEPWPEKLKPVKGGLRMILWPCRTIFGCTASNLALDSWMGELISGNLVVYVKMFSDRRCCTCQNNYDAFFGFACPNLNANMPARSRPDLRPRTMIFRAINYFLSVFRLWHMCHRRWSFSAYALHIPVQVQWGGVQHLHLGPGPPDRAQGLVLDPCRWNWSPRGRSGQVGKLRLWLSHPSGPQERHNPLPPWWGIIIFSYVIVMIRVKI